jgi:hypothetical protein
VRVGDEQVARAAEVLTAVLGATTVDADGEAPGWLRVGAHPDRAPELNRALVAAGVDVHRLEAGSDLERIFLSLTQD